MEARSETFEDVKKSIQGTINDPLAKLLLQHSHLTKPQLETILADSISQEKALKKAQRRQFRPSKKHISRGAYNRSLIQAQNNIIRSIYTILLLGYLELFDSPSMQPFLELADGLKGYAEELKVASTTSPSFGELKSKLWESISDLSGRRSFKDTM